MKADNFVRVVSLQREGFKFNTYGLMPEGADTSIPLVLLKEERDEVTQSGDS
jgi:hypothetical protein